MKVFYGQNSFKMEEEVLSFAKEGVEVINVGMDGVGDSINELVTQSFFVGKRLFIYRQVLGKLPTDIEERLLKSVKNSVETEIVFLEEKAPTKSKIFNAVKKEGAVKEFQKLSGTNLVPFIKDKVAKEGGDISPLAAERLATFVGGDLWQLTEEIKKLVLYKKSEDGVEAIQVSDVDLLVKANFEANIFGLMDAIVNKNTKKATDLLGSFLESGENGIYILTMITKQFRNIAMIKFEPDLTEKKFSEQAGIHPYVAKKAFEQAKRYPEDAIREMYGRLREADLHLKSGYDPAQVLLRLIV